MNISARVSIFPTLILAIRAELFLSPAISETALADLSVRDRSRGFQALSPRERQVLRIIAEAKTNRAIAEILRISVKTVEKHRSNLMSKLNVHDLPGLMRYALKHRLVSLE